MWELGQPEAESIAAAVNDVARHYPAVAVAQEVQDWINLALVMGVSYGGRMRAYGEERRASQARNVNPAPPQPVNPNGRTRGFEEVEIPGLGKVAVPITHH